jgi:hypothetical protein
MTIFFIDGYSSDDINLYSNAATNTHCMALFQALDISIVSNKLKIWIPYAMS